MPVEPETLARLVADDRPRAVVVAGHGRLRDRGRRRGRGRRPDLPGAGRRRTAATGCPAGSAPLDLVVAVSCSGGTEETLAAAAEARAPRLPGWSPSARAGSPLAAAATAAGRVHLPVDAHGRMPRASLWALAVAGARGRSTRSASADVPRDLLTRSADALDAAGRALRARRRHRRQPGQDAGARAGRHPAVLWGASDAGERRGAPRRRPAGRERQVPGGRTARCPRPHHDQVVVLAGVFGALAPTAPTTTSSATRSTTGPAGRGCGCCCCATPTSCPRSAAPGGRVAPGRRASTACASQRAARRRASTRWRGWPAWSPLLDFATRLPGAGCRASTPRPIAPIVALKAGLAERRPDERRRRHPGDRRGAARQPRHRGHEVRGVPAHRRRRRCWPRRSTRSPTPATRCCCCSAAAGRSATRPRSTRSATAASATSTRSSSRSCCSASAACSRSTRASTRCSTRSRSTRWQWVPIVVLLVAIVLEAFSFRTAIRESNHVRGSRPWVQFIRRAKAPELPVVLLEDFAALIGLVLRAARRRADADHRQRRLGRRRHRSRSACCWSRSRRPRRSRPRACCSARRASPTAQRRIARGARAADAVGRAGHPHEDAAPRARGAAGGGQDRGAPRPTRAAEVARRHRRGRGARSARPSRSPG